MRRTIHFFVLLASSSMILLQGSRSEHTFCSFVQNIPTITQKESRMLTRELQNNSKFSENQTWGICSKMNDLALPYGNIGFVPKQYSSHIFSRSTIHKRRTSLNKKTYRRRNTRRETTRIYDMKTQMGKSKNTIERLGRQNYCLIRQTRKTTGKKLGADSREICHQDNLSGTKRRQVRNTRTEVPIRRSSRKERQANNNNRWSASNNRRMRSQERRLNVNDVQSERHERRSVNIEIRIRSQFERNMFSIGQIRRNDRHSTQRRQRLNNEERQTVREARESDIERSNIDRQRRRSNIMKRHTDTHIRQSYRQERRLNRQERRPISSNKRTARQSDSLERNLNRQQRQSNSNAMETGTQLRSFDNTDRRLIRQERRSSSPGRHVTKPVRQSDNKERRPFSSVRQVRLLDIKDRRSQPQNQREKILNRPNIRNLWQSESQRRLNQQERRSTNPEKQTVRHIAQTGSGHRHFNRQERRYSASQVRLSGSKEKRIISKKIQPLDERQNGSEDGQMMIHIRQSDTQVRQKRESVSLLGRSERNVRRSNRMKSQLRSTGRNTDNQKHIYARTERRLNKHERQHSRYDEWVNSQTLKQEQTLDYRQSGSKERRSHSKNKRVRQGRTLASTERRISRKNKQSRRQDRQTINQSRSNDHQERGLRYEDSLAYRRERKSNGRLTKEDRRTFNRTNQSRIQIRRSESKDRFAIEDKNISFNNDKQLMIEQTRSQIRRALDVTFSTPPSLLEDNAETRIYQKLNVSIQDTGIVVMKNMVQQLFNDLTNKDNSLNGDSLSKKYDIVNSILDITSASKIVIACCLGLVSTGLVRK